MTDQEPGAPRRKEAFSPALMAIAAIALTAAVLFAIKTFVGGGTEDSQPQAGAQDVFRQAQETGGDSGPKPDLRAASTAVGGDSLGMFAKTNAGYAAEEEEAQQEEKAEEKPKTEPAKTAAKPAASGAARAAAAPRPKLQPVKGFDSSSGSGSGSINAAKAGGMPDVSSILKTHMGAVKDANTEMNKPATR